jgi:flagellar motor switch protein FliG
MKNELSVEMKAQSIVENTMEDITRATRKVLMDYVSKMYVVSFAKVIAYLGLESEDALDLLNGMDADTRRQVEDFAKDYQKSDAKVISEVEHIVTASGMDFTDDYKIIKDNIILSGKTFAENAVHNFQKETPIFKKKIEDCLFCFEDFQYLDDRAIQKVLRETDMQELAKALKGASTEVQDKIFRNMSQRAANMLKEDMEWMGPVRTQDVEAAQASLVQIVFNLSNKGDILLALKDDHGKLCI